MMSPAPYGAELTSAAGARPFGRPWLAVNAPFCERTSGREPARFSIAIPSKRPFADSVYFSTSRSQATVLPRTTNDKYCSQNFRSDREWFTKN